MSLRWRVGVVVLGALVVVGAGKPAAKVAPKAAMATELALPAFQSSTMQEDLPAGDVLLDDNGVAWIAGSTSIWRWDGARSTLQRIVLDALVGVPVGPLRHVASDGVSLFVADDRQVWRVQFNPIRVLRYGLPDGLTGTSFGFGGSGDDIRWIHSTGVYWVDRYGKRLQMKIAAPGLQKGDRVVADQAADASGGRRAFVARGRDVSMRLFDGSGRATTSRVVYAGKQAILDFRRSGSGFVGISAYHAFHLDAAGTLVKATPVEGRRRLVAMDASATAHAFYFNDGLLELFDLGKKSMRAWQLGERPASGCDVFRVSDEAAVCLTSGNVRFFSLGGLGAPDRGPPPESPAAPEPRVK